MNKNSNTPSRAWLAQTNRFHRVLGWPTKTCIFFLSMLIETNMAELQHKVHVLMDFFKDLNLSLTEMR